MLSAKPWTWDAVIRLILGAIVCLCLGSVVVSMWRYAGPGGRSQWIFMALAGTGLVLLLISLIILIRQWAQEDLVHLLLILLACLLGGLAFVGWAQKIASLPNEASSGEQMVVAEAVVLLVFIGFLRARRIKWSELFGINNNRKQAILAGLALACIFLPVAEGLQWGSYHLITGLRLEPQEQEAVRALRVTNTWTNRF